MPLLRSPQTAKQQLHLVSRDMQAWNGAFHLARRFINPVKVGCASLSWVVLQLLYVA